ncbi:hypothetical protein [Haladaptatus sp. NG-SE-30]
MATSEPQVDETVEPSTDTEQRPWHRDSAGIRIVALYIVLSLVGAIAVSRPVIELSTTTELANAVGIPPISSVLGSWEH